jgi:hypothetical protein
MISRDPLATSQLSRSALPESAVTLPFDNKVVCCEMDVYTQINQHACITTFNLATAQFS